MRIAGKKLNTAKIAVLFLVPALLCVNPAKANELSLNQDDEFNPLMMKTTAQINTATSRQNGSKTVYIEDTPLPKFIEQFFAPENTPLTENNEEKAEQKQNQENPFKTLDSFVSPSEFAKLKKPVKINNTQTLPKLPSIDDITEMLPVEEKNIENPIYDNLVEETEYNMPDYDGKTISGIKFHGLNLISEKILTPIIKTRPGTIFNSEIIQNDLQKIYSIGYFTDSMYVEPEIQEDDSIDLTFVLEENVTVNKVKTEGNTVYSDNELSQFVHPLAGLPQNINLINEAIENINHFYENDGYILAKVTNVDDDTDGTLKFTISEGIIKEINLDGNKKTKDYVIERNIMTKIGDVYNENIFKKDVAKLYDTQIFDKVDRKFEPCPNNENEYILTVKVSEASSNSVSIGLGVDNALGGFGQIIYNEKNLFGRNQKLSVSGMLGTGLLMSDNSIKNRMNWNIEVNFLEPYFFNENNSLAAKLFYRDLGSYQIPLAEEKRWGGMATLEHKVRGYDNLTTSLALGYENIKLKEGDFNKIAYYYRASGQDIGRRDEQLAGGGFFNLSPGIKYSTLDSEFMPREGIVAKANFMEALGVSHPKRTNGRLVGGITKYIPIAKKSTLLIGAKGGIKVHGDHMPEVMAFRLGGPYTIRGFRMNGVGTGESFVMASTELQTPIPFMDRFKYDFLKNLRFAFFMDAGRVFEPTISSKLYDRPLSAITAGVGLRVNIPGMGPIAVDYGLPLTNTGKYNSQHGYFTFGTGGLYDNY